MYEPMLDAKLWLTPEVRIAKSFGFSRREQADLVRIGDGG